jgi:hypothetical protein
MIDLGVTRSDYEGQSLMGIAPPSASAAKAKKSEKIYPYGLDITLTDVGVIERLGLMEARTGEVYGLAGRVKITAMRNEDRIVDGNGKVKPDRSITLQLRAARLDLEISDKDAAAEFRRAAKR